jgi:hypothetical protein
MPHPVDGLFSEMRRALQKYPAGMVPVPVEEGLVQGTSFFPGGYGLYKKTDEELPEWPQSKVMVVGNDWGDFSSFLTARDAGREATGSTWRGILDLLPRGLHPLTLRNCFFTNAFMGLRVAISLRSGKVESGSVGESPGRRDLDFKRQCWEFLAYQIRLQKPRLILSLGRFVPDMLSRLSPELSNWRNDGDPHWNEIDQAGPLRTDVPFVVLGDTRITVCALTHPDRAWLNYRQRTYGPYRDETGLLRAAVRMAAFAEAGGDATLSR